ncbi:hypothetical protein [Asticcacaulis benevestitus]|uniref:MarR family transcriptional regulator n=1 Tax=Asticcacaulis benevestitus DSM 16100 = ATCC BAA-896 TaxID=1121022 RepID=V4P6P2_9CAUL|nr:hypothetical protein [Asticcacaulis benevestitus]ESQ82789.1 hypothetical protein ABENE_20785 [Asticcacaulis benevestitus DSM 16100 = ATCC BAA-896]
MCINAIVDDGKTGCKNITALLFIFMAAPHRTLGTLLRHLVENLDEAVEGAYVEAGLDYRPRYTPVLRSLMELGPSSIKALAKHAGLTHSAASQTIAQMARTDVVDLRRGVDQREQVVSMTAKAEAMIPVLKRIWLNVNTAADALDAELAFPISRILEEAIDALERRPFGDRIAAAAMTPEIL